MTSLTSNPTPKTVISAGVSSALERIEALSVVFCQERFGHRVRALVLTGSNARGEASVLRTVQGWRVLGDAEFMLVLDRAISRDGARTKALAQDVRRPLAEQQVQCEVTFSAVDGAYLRTLEPHIFGYELRTCGRVLCGETDILELIPDFLPSAIRVEDGWQMLCNRLVEQLDCADEIFSSEVADRLRYRMLKLYLDMATSLLLFLGRYKPTYVERARELGHLDTGLAGKVPVSDLAEKVHAATHLKLHPQDAAAEAEFFRRHSWGRAIRDAELLWRWELERLLETTELLDNRDLISRKSRRQPLFAQLRGWAYVVRACGLSKTIRSTPHWLRLARRGSPRHLIYAAACELLFSLAAEDGDPGAGLQAMCRRLRSSLPIDRKSTRLNSSHIPLSRMPS